MSNPSCHNYPRGNLNISAHPAHSYTDIESSLKKVDVTLCLLLRRVMMKLPRKTFTTTPPLRLKKMRNPPIPFYKVFFTSESINLVVYLITVLVLLPIFYYVRQSQKWVILRALKSPQKFRTPSCSSADFLGSWYISSLKSKSYYEIWTSWLILHSSVSAKSGWTI